MSKDFQLLFLSFAEIAAWVLNGCHQERFLLMFKRPCAFSECEQLPFSLWFMGGGGFQLIQKVPFL